MKLLQQLRHDFPDAEFDYGGILLTVNGRRTTTYLTESELVTVDPATRSGRKYYRFFANLVYNHFGVKPTAGSLAESLIIDENEARRNAIAAWLSERRIAFIEDGEDYAAISYEIEGDRPPARRISYDPPSEVEYLEGERNSSGGSTSVDHGESPDTADNISPSASTRTPEEQAEWETRMTSVAEEAERIKREMREEWANTVRPPDDTSESAQPAESPAPSPAILSRLFRIVRRIIGTGNHGP